MESECFLHQIIKNHKAEVKRILERPRQPVPEDFRSRPIYQTPIGLLTLEKIEQEYSKFYSDWDKKFQCFPEGPLFRDKLFDVQPYTRATDIEMKKDELNERDIIHKFYEKR